MFSGSVGTGKTKIYKKILGGFSVILALLLILIIIIKYGIMN